MPPPAAAQGMGDVLLTYENEAIFTNLVVPEKDRLPFIVPNNNIRVGGAAASNAHCAPGQPLAGPSGFLSRMRRCPQIQCPLALVDANLADAPPETREAAAAFCNYLYTKEAQREFAACGFR
jgi:sulfate transport system substrate-binding protein